MKALFLESEAARQCQKYAVETGLNEVEAQEVLDLCYFNANAAKQRNRIGPDDWWVNQCLNDDHHKDISLRSLFGWRHTPEGDAFWRNVDRIGGE